MLNAILFIGLPTAVILAFGIAFRISAARDRRKLKTTRAALRPDHRCRPVVLPTDFAEALGYGAPPTTIYRGREPLSEDHPYQRCLRDVGPKGLP